MPDMLNNKINWARNQANYYITTNEKTEVKEPVIESNLDLPDDGPIETPESVYKLEKTFSLSENANIPENMKILRSSSQNDI